MKYNWEHKNWPEFNYNPSVIDQLVIEFASESGEVKGIMEGLPDNFKQEAVLQFMIDEAMKTSEIEGEYYSRHDVMSSIKNRLGLQVEHKFIKDKNARGIGELMVEVQQDFAKPLSAKLIKSWHTILFDNDRFINKGQYRTGDEPMVIVSGRYGKEEIHYQAPPSTKVPSEMKRFVDWYENFKIRSKDLKSALIKTAIAHLYFESIHPFEDGNGRIGRAIAEKCLSEALGRPIVMSLSTVIEHDKKTYYDALKQAQRTLDLTPWILYFTQTILMAQNHAKKLIRFTLRKATFLDAHSQVLNERQRKVILKILDKGLDGFKGGMTAKKYISIAKTSKATATRDLQDLVDKGVFILKGAGRSTYYELKF
ncbi:Fic family protein [Zhouia amylolytica]|uniref:Fic family protein n=1 Tax=Zhouia amylolytica TaxID=376730 RepID=A0A1I6T4V2_9FLAO|nr:Fic family protein [Zhouia amylolytica]SFS84216.1 Fic family protein [Zhouia amylolytica]